jgi:hypothetical protein
MPEEFEGDLVGAVFWGADLSGARFRDVNLTDATISHAWLVNVDIDALVDTVVINGVDVTAYVNERDPWYPLRAMLRPSDPEGMRATWVALEDEWAKTINPSVEAMNGRTGRSRQDECRGRRSSCVVADQGIRCRRRRARSPRRTDTGGICRAGIRESHPLGRPRVDQGFCLRLRDELRLGQIRGRSCYSSEASSKRRPVKANRPPSHCPGSSMRSNRCIRCLTHHRHLQHLRRRRHRAGHS